MIFVSNSPLVSYTKISPNKTSPRNHKIDTITIHCYVGQVTVERLGRGFYSASAKTSCNYGIGLDGRIGMFVEEKDRSWCSSNRKNDHRAITIECASESTHPYAINEKVYKALVELCADICKRNDIKELKWRADKSLIGQPDKQNMTVHRWFANKACPGQYIYERLGQIANEVNAKLGVETQDSDDLAQDEQIANEVNTKLDVETYGFDDFVRDVQEACGAKVDGIVGPETLSKTVTVSAKVNRKHPVVKPIQKRLNALGYTVVGNADGIAGPKFTTAIKNFQRDSGCYVIDGEVTAQKTTWRKLLGR